MRGGGVLDWIRPLSPQGTRAPGVLGCYRAGFEHWNLRNPKPGYTFRYVHKKKVASRRYQGYVIAKAEHAELAGDLPMGGPTGISDALLETENMILMAAPTERVADNIANLQARTKSAVEGNVHNYLANERGSEGVYGNNSKRPIRFDDGTAGGFDARYERE